MLFFKKKKQQTDNISPKELPTQTSKRDKQIGLNNKETYKSLFDHHPDIIFTLSPSGEILDVNKMIELIGYQPQEISGMFKKYVPKEEYTKNHEKFKLVLEGSPQNYNTKLTHKNGHTLNINVTSIPIMHNNEIVGVFGIIKNISELKQKERELLRAQNSLELAQKTARIGNWDFDTNTGQTFWSKNLYKILGIKTKGDLPPSFEEILEFVHPGDREHLKNTVENAHAKKTDYEIQYRMNRFDGQLRYINEKVQMIVDENDELTRIIGVVQDITNKHLAEEKLKQNEVQFHALYNNLEAGIWSLDLTSNQFSFLSTAIEELCGYSIDSLYKNKLAWSNIIHPEDRPAYLLLQDNLIKGKALHHQYRIIHKNGDIRWIQDHTIPILNEAEEVTYLYGMVTDITVQKEFEEKMLYLAYHDQLTELPNRRHFDEKLYSLVKESEKTGKSFAVLSLNIDRFKYINDSLGHSVGDELIKIISHRLEQLIGKNDILARMGGDEFGILVTEYTHNGQLTAFVKNILTKIKMPIKLNGYELYMTTSIGLSMYPADGEDADSLIKNANAALYRAKELGKDNYQVYSPRKNILAYKSFLFEKDLRFALANNQFQIYYQPRIDILSKKIVSAEALIRWVHPDWGLVSPAEFIPLAEESGFINDIGKWVVRSVCQQIKAWEQQAKPIVPISINISSKSLQKYNWNSSLNQILQETNINPYLLEFEITENAILHKDEVIDNAINFIKERGIKLSLDDFGTGYSSITNLKHYTFDFIKIDRSYIQNLTEKTPDALIVKTMIQFTHDLNMKVVAEGVETIEQLQRLQEYGCDEVQGYLFSKPVDVSTLEKLLQNLVIIPVKPKSPAKLVKERRKFNRIELPFPLSCQMTISKIKGQSLSLGVSEIIVDNIGHGGIHFYTHIKLPVHSDILLKITADLLGEKIDLYGNVVWQNEIKDHVFEYGLKYTAIDKEHLEVILNKLKEALQKTPLFQKKYLITEDKIKYIEKLRYKF